MSTICQKIIKNNLLNKEDGHPSTFTNNSFFTDTYLMMITLIKPHYIIMISIMKN